MASAAKRLREHASDNDRPSKRTTIAQQRLSSSSSADESALPRRRSRQRVSRKSTRQPIKLSSRGSMESGWAHYTRNQYRWDDASVGPRPANTSLSDAEDSADEGEVKLLTLEIIILSSTIFIAQISGIHIEREKTIERLKAMELAYDEVKLRARARRQQGQDDPKRAIHQCRGSPRAMMHAVKGKRQAMSNIKWTLKELIKVKECGDMVGEVVCCNRLQEYITQVRRHMTTRQHILGRKPSGRYNSNDAEQEASADQKDSSSDEDMAASTKAHRLRQWIEESATIK